MNDEELGYVLDIMQMRGDKLVFLLLLGAVQVNETPVDAARRIVTLEALAVGRTQRAAAHILGVHPVYIHRWTKALKEGRRVGQRMTYKGERW